MSGPGCANVLSQFNITLAYFESSNPEVGPNCGSFVPGNTYCIFRAPTTGTLIQPSTNGLCGMQQNWTNTCVGSQWGNCCGSGGVCGSGEDYCAKGNCQEGSCDGGKVYSTDGLCGRDYDNLPCPPKFGACCSQYGFCGNAVDFCGTGCQSGQCQDSSTTISSTIQTSTPGPGSTSKVGTCGFNLQQTCKGSKFGDCCSAAGYCGYDLYHCAYLLGCQIDYGTCNGTLANAIVIMNSSSNSTSKTSSTNATTRSG